MKPLGWKWDFSTCFPNWWLWARCLHLNKARRKWIWTENLNNTYPRANSTVWCDVPTLAVPVPPELEVPHRIPEGSLFLENQAYSVAPPSLLGFAHDTAYVCRDLGASSNTCHSMVTLSQPSLIPHMCVNSWSYWTRKSNPFLVKCSAGVEHLWEGQLKSGCQGWQVSTINMLTMQELGPNLDPQHPHKIQAWHTHQ